MVNQNQGLKKTTESSTIQSRHGLKQNLVLSLARKLDLIEADEMPTEEKMQWILEESERLREEKEKELAYQEEQNYSRYLMELAKKLKEREALNSTHVECSLMRNRLGKNIA